MIVGQLLPHRLSYLGKAHSRLDVALTYTDMPYHHSRRDQKGSVNQLKRQENLIRRKKKVLFTWTFVKQLGTLGNEEILSICEKTWSIPFVKCPICSFLLKFFDECH